MRYAIVPVLALLLVPCGGCATILTGGGEKQKVKFASNPPGADVYVDDQLVGRTPVRARLDRTDDHRVRMELAGYQPYEKTIESGFNPWVVGNVLFGGLIGVGVDLVSGAHTSLHPGGVKAALVKHDAAPPTALSSYVTRPPAGGSPYGTHAK